MPHYASRPAEERKNKRAQTLNVTIAPPLGYFASISRHEMRNVGKYHAMFALKTANANGPRSDGPWYVRMGEYKGSRDCVLSESYAVHSPDSTA